MTDSSVSFLPLAQLVGEERLQELLAIFDSEMKNMKTPLEKQRLSILRDWLMNDVAVAEIILMTRPFAEQTGVDSLTLLGGIMVRS